MHQVAPDTPQPQRFDTRLLRKLSKQDIHIHTAYVDLYMQHVHVVHRERQIMAHAYYFVTGFIWSQAKTSPGRFSTHGILPTSRDLGF